MTLKKRSPEVAKCRQTGAPKIVKILKNLPRRPPKSTPEKDFEKAPILRPSGLHKCCFFIVGVIKNKKSRVPETAPKSMFNFVGTAEEDKRLVFYDSGHWPLPRNQMIKETLSWLDRYEN